VDALEENCGDLTAAPADSVGGGRARKRGVFGIEVNFSDDNITSLGDAQKKNKIGRRVWTTHGIGEIPNAARNARIPLGIRTQNSEQNDKNNTPVLGGRRDLFFV